MNLFQADARIVIRRAPDFRVLDPDTLHGVLFLAEGGTTEAQLSKLLSVTVSEIRAAFSKARNGNCHRVPPVNLNSGDAREPALPGLFPRRWMRELVALMLRPDGVLSGEVEVVLESCGRGSSGAGSAVSDLRGELRILNIAIESRPIGAGFIHRYRVIGNDAWRLQKIIANGWAL
ncbi:MAG: hypothetical protein P4M09_17025 [Devosia sp.]|nr:hypothetical protein [Devosia sp.]